jgi:hypothetical protein
MMSLRTYILAGVEFGTSDTEADVMPLRHAARALLVKHNISLISCFGIKSMKTGSIRNKNHSSRCKTNSKVIVRMDETPIFICFNFDRWICHPRCTTWFPTISRKTSSTSPHYLVTGNSNPSGKDGPWREVGPYGLIPTVRSS